MASASISAFLKSKELQGAKASGGSFVRFKAGEYLVLVESALFEKTRKGFSSMKMGVRIVSSTSAEPTMQPGRIVDAYVGDSSSDLFLNNVRQVVDALFGIYGITKEQIDVMPEAEFLQHADGMFMEAQEAAGNYLFVRAVDSGKPNPKTPGENYINPAWKTPRASDIVAAGIALDPAWVGVVE